MAKAAAAAKLNDNQAKANVMAASGMALSKHHISSISA